MTNTSADGKIKFKIKSRVTREHIKIDFDTEYFIKVQAPMFESEENSETRTVRARKSPKEAVKRDMEAPVLMDVITLDDGKEGRIIVNAVLEAELMDAYGVARFEEGDITNPETGEITRGEVEVIDHTYVGKCFRIVKRKLEGKRYAGWDITEIELEDDAEETAPETAPAETVKGKGKK